MCVLVYACMCVSMYVCECMTVCMCLYICVYMCVGVCLSLYVCTTVCMYISAHFNAISQDSMRYFIVPLTQMSLDFSGRTVVTRRCHEGDKEATVWPRSCRAVSHRNT